MLNFFLKITSILFAIFFFVTLFMLGILFFSFFINTFISAFDDLVVENSIFYIFTNINVLHIIYVSFLLGTMLIAVLVVIGMIFLILVEAKLLLRDKMNKSLVFIQKLLVAIYPTLILAAAFDESTFSLITNVISFFLIFSFIFKSDKFE